MLKSIVACAIALMLISGTAWAQFPEIGPSYYRLENTITTGVKVVLNPNFETQATPRFVSYIISDEAKFWVSGYRYVDKTWVKVFPQGTTPADTAVYWHANIALPITTKIDVLCFTSSLSDGGADLVVYK